MQRYILFYAGLIFAIAPFGLSGEAAQGGKQHHLKLRKLSSVEQGFYILEHDLFIDFFPFLSDSDMQNQIRSILVCTKRVAGEEEAKLQASSCKLVERYVKYCSSLSPYKHVYHICEADEKGAFRRTLPSGEYTYITVFPWHDSKSLKNGYGYAFTSQLPTENKTDFFAPGEHGIFLINQETYKIEACFVDNGIEDGHIVRLQIITKRLKVDGLGKE